LPPVSPSPFTERGKEGKPSLISLFERERLVHPS
jgi:hypothetical protein